MITCEACKTARATHKIYKKDIYKLVCGACNEKYSTSETQSVEFLVLKKSKNNRVPENENPPHKNQKK